MISENGKQQTAHDSQDKMPTSHESSLTRRKGLAMSEAPQSWHTVLEAIESGLSVWTNPAELAARLGSDLDETTDVLAALDIAGLILVREPDSFDGPVVALAPRGAERLIVRRELRPVAVGV